MRIGVAIAFVLGLAAAALLLPVVPAFRDPSFWLQQASPGPLSAAHASLDERCAACHTPVEGVEAASCIVCHANETALLQRQPTAFHASIGACAECHREHQGRQPPPAMMDHRILAAIGLGKVSRAEPGSEERQLYDQLVHATAMRPRLAQPKLEAFEAMLACGTCHGSKDRHWGLFGTDCAECHAATAWTIAEFRHPPPSSIDCAQCHKAPPSHFMGHFEMVSMKVAGREHARVEQCYLCHQTTAWNDIRSVGVYKHH